MISGIIIDAPYVQCTFYPTSVPEYNMALPKNGKIERFGITIPLFRFSH